MKTCFLLLRRAACLALAVVFLCLAAAAPARAEEARDITSKCKFRLSFNRNDKDYLLDDNYKTFWRSGKKGWLEITTPKDTPCFGLYVKWAETMVDVQIETQDENGNWELHAAGPKDHFYNQYIPIDGLTHFRIHSLSEKPSMCVGEIQVLSEGEVPDWVEIWQPFSGKADLMVVAAHPDDELLYMGGVIPYYRGQLGKKVLVAYLTKQPASRKCELLDGLWVCGVREYPVVSSNIFKDEYTASLKKMLSVWNGKKLEAYVTGLLRQYQPDVVVTHDLNGEYGHGAHRAAAWALSECVKLAADEKYDPDSLKAFGPWQVKKLYLHLYAENQVVMDWRQPLSAFGGKTAFDVACAAFKKHRTQQSGKYEVEDSGRYDNRLFGLYFSTVGEDEAKNDLFEHIPSGV